MVKEEQITFKAGSIVDGCIADSVSWKECHQRLIEGAKWTDTHSHEPSLPFNLDEAAQKVEDYYDVGEEHGYLYCHRGDIKDAFKAGAEWMAAQGETFNGYISMKGKRSLIAIEGKSEYKFGDKVIVQIRKK